MGSMVDTTSLGCSIVSTPRPATSPENRTRPDAGARTADPATAAMSIPRWPRPYADSGAMNSRTTLCGASTGQIHEKLSTPALAGELPHAPRSTRQAMVTRARTGPVTRATE